MYTRVSQSLRNVTMEYSVNCFVLLQLVVTIQICKYARRQKQFSALFELIKNTHYRCIVTEIRRTKIK